MQRRIAWGNAMKHPQHIVAFDKKAFHFDELGPLIHLSAKVFFESAYASLFIGRRHELESDERFSQLLPYIVLRTRAADGAARLFLYQRTKQVGESRLGGKFSIGTGGHVDLADVKHNESVIDVVATLVTAVTREQSEELEFFDEETETVHSYASLRGLLISRGILHPMLPKFYGLINDNYGAVFTVDVPPGFEPRCKEPELTTCGWVSVDEAAGFDLENWSKLLIETPEFIEVA